ncbi:MAG: hypothetical protein QGD88_13290, partial [Anaerolineae bacterium]|nr:hypothetical protein [Anaerolineae bacterium]
MNTLTCTDVCTGWTDITGLSHRSQEPVCEPVQLMRQRLSFPLLGSEFINDLLYRYCLKEKITFTRSRPYKKNDQAHVEQKNWSVVRHTVGYERWETEQELTLLESIYDDLRLYINFFQSSIKLIAKVRTEPVCARKGVEVNGLAIRLSSGMIQPRHLTSVYS